MNYKVLGLLLVVGFVLLLPAIFLGCEEKNDNGGEVTTPIVSPQGIEDFGELDKLCWQLELKKSGNPPDWMITCVFEKRIPHVSPYHTITVIDADLSKALSEALSQVRSKLGVDSVVFDRSG